MACCWMLLFQICSLLLYDLFTHLYLISVHFYSCHLLLGESIKFNQHVRSKEACLEHQLPFMSVSHCGSGDVSPINIKGSTAEWGGWQVSARFGWCRGFDEGFLVRQVILGVGERLKTVED